MRKGWLKYLRVLSLVTLACTFTTGCWDRTELNELAIVLATGSDLTEQGEYELSDQIVVPAQLGSGSGGGAGDGKKYVVFAATGHDLLEAAQVMQTKLSRRIFLGHRRAIFIGEALARKGLSHVLDEYSRNPDLRLRGDIFLVLHGKAIDALKTPHPLERLPALSDVKSLKTAGGPTDVTMRDFLMAATSDSSWPVMQAIEVGKGASEGESSDSAQRKIVGTAIFDKQLRYVGLLEFNDAILRQWIVGQVSRQFITTFVPPGNGYVTIDASHLSSSIQATWRQGQLTFYVTLKGRGVLKENETNLDLNQNKNMLQIEHYLNQKTEANATKMIRFVQQRYQGDIFGFDETVHRQLPLVWRRLRKNWPLYFSQARVVVKTDLVVRRTGQTGPSLELSQASIQK